MFKTLFQTKNISMKKMQLFKVAYTALGLLLNTLLFSQAIVPTYQAGSNEEADWELLNPKPSSLTGRDIHFLNDQIGFIVNGREILKTMDGGDTWELMMEINSGNQISFMNSTGYVIGNYGSIYKTTNSGDEWNRIIFPYTDHLISVSIIHEDTVLITGDNKLFVSNDGGQSWEYHAVNDVNIEDACFTSTDTGHIACKYGIIRKTVDGGLNWYTTESVNHTPANFFDIYFVTPQIGFASREHTDVLKTTDGGETWTVIASPDAIYSINFLTDNIGYIAGEFGAIHKTVDGGTSWEWVGFDGRKYGNSLFGIHFINQNTGYGVGSRGRIIKTTNGGSSWKEYASTYNQINQISTLSPDTIYALGKQLYKSTDGGQSWDTLHTGVYDEDRYQYSFIHGHFISSDEFFVIASAGELSYVLKSTDGGESFEFLKTDGLNIRGTSVQFLNPQIGYVMNNHDSFWSGLHKTKDGGKTWEEVSRERFSDFWFLDENIGLGIKNGDLYRTLDGGFSWEQYTDVGRDLSKIDFANDTLGYISGDNGLVLKTLNKGQSWQELRTDSDDNYALSFYNHNIGYVSGEDNKLHKTMNGGLSWETSLLPGSIKSIHITSDLGIIVAGANGLIMSKTIEVDELVAELHQVENQTDDKALITGTMASNAALISDIRIEYGQDLMFDHSLISSPEIIESGYADSIIAEISNLEANKEYGYRMRWNYSGKVNYSDTLFFKTLSEYELDLNFISLVEPNKAELIGKALSREEEITDIVIEYSQDSSFASYAVAVPGSVEGETEAVISCLLTPLEPDTKYHTRIRASYQGGWIYSQVLSFQTMPLFNIVQILPEFQGSDVSIGAYVTSYLGTMRNILFEYGTSFDYGDQIEASPDSVIKNWNTKVHAKLINLDTSQVYYYRIKAEMDGLIIYSKPEIINFQGGVLMVPMEVEQLSNQQVKLQALVSAGGGNLYRLYFEYGENGEFRDSVQADPHYIWKDETVVLSAQLDGLRPEIPYIFRVRAEVFEEKIYSEDFTFTLSTLWMGKTSMLHSELDIFPNPADDYLIINSSEQGDKLMLINIHGKVLLDQTYQQHLDISELNPGLYFIILYHQDRIKTGRFIKH